MTLAKGWDCHAHLFGPYERFPLAANRSYTPPEATETQYFELLSTLGLANGVLVHPSAYGEDYARLFDALTSYRNLRGVIVVRRHTLPTLVGLREKGVRAARFSHRSGAVGNFAGSASFDDMMALAPALADAGLHAEMWTDTRALPAIASQLERLPVKIVIDHMAMFDLNAGVDDPGFKCLLSLLERGHIMVKLCAYRNLLTAPDFELGRPFHRAMLEANPEGLLWGSDWPHLNVKRAPDTLQLLEAFKRWTGDEALIERILVTNPSALYA